MCGMYEMNVAVHSLIQTEMSVLLVIKVWNRLQKNSCSRLQLRRLRRPLFRLLLPRHPRSSLLFSRLPSRNDLLLAPSLPLQLNYSCIYFIFTKWSTSQNITCYSSSFRTQYQILKTSKPDFQFMDRSRNFAILLNSWKCL